MRRGLLKSTASGGLDLSLVSYWTFDTDFTDFYSANNLVFALGTNPPDIFITTGGQVNDCVEVRNIGKALVNNTPTNLSFGNGTTDNPFSISLWFNMDVVKNTFFMHKRESNAVAEYQVFYYSGSLGFWLFSNNSIANRIEVNYPFTPTASTWYNLIVTYDGSGLASGLSMYLNNVNVGTASTSGTYIAMNDLGSAFSFPAKFANYNIDGKIDEGAVANVEWSSAQRDYVYNQGLNGLNLI